MSRARTERGIVPKPATDPVWMGRDTDENGVLRQWVTIWTRLPTRWPITGGGFGWRDEIAGTNGYAESVWTIDAIKRYGVIPDDDRQLIRFDCGIRR